jgi:proteasome lid subunit RPN8/RPN11
MDDLIPSLTIPPDLKAKLETLAGRDYPHESCGFLLGEADDWGYHVLDLYAADNSRDGDRERFYAIDRAAYAAAEREAAAAGRTILGVYHTHPDAPPTPSDTDADFAFPGWVYWISRVDAGRAGDARVWLRTWDPPGWEELVLIVACC